MRMIFAGITQRYRLKAQVTPSADASITLRPRGGMMLRLHRRR